MSDGCLIKVWDESDDDERGRVNDSEAFIHQTGEMCSNDEHEWYIVTDMV